MATAILETLLDAQKTQIAGVSGIESDNIFFGEQNSLEQFKDTQFPLVEIFFDQVSVGEADYDSQRIRNINVRFTVFIHVLTTTDQRDSGVDMKSLINLGETVRAELFKFNNSGNEPVPEMIVLNPDMNIQYTYEEFNELINTIAFQYSFHLQIEDTKI